MRVAISGASGLVGSALSETLRADGHHVVHLVRRPPEPATTAAGDAAQWSPERGLEDPQALGALDAVVHLAGENVAAGRWSRARRQRIYASRVAGTQNLLASLRELERPPATFVCASATGYYGDRGDEPVAEDAEPGRGFLARVCIDWEAAAAEAETVLGARVVRLRFGVVLASRGGALERMLPLFRLGLGGRLGSGRQYFPWISLADAVAATRLALASPRIRGPVNVVAPEAVTNAELTRALSKTLHRPALLPAPALALRLVLGEMAQEMLLSGARVEPRRLLKESFEYTDPRLEPCLERLLGPG